VPSVAVRYVSKKTLLCFKRARSLPCVCLYQASEGVSLGFKGAAGLATWWLPRGGLAVDSWREKIKEKQCDGPAIETASVYVAQYH